MKDWGKRLEKLEDRSRSLDPDADEAQRSRERLRGLRWQMMDEMAYLKVSRASYHRGGVRYEGEDIPLRLLGPNYTGEQLQELAIRRVLARQPDLIPDDVEALLPRWVAVFEGMAEMVGDGRK